MLIKTLDEELLYVNWWGLTGNGKSTFFRRVMNAYGEDAFPWQKDTTRKMKLRPGEGGSPEYRSISKGYFRKRVRMNYYRYPPDPIYDGGIINFTGFPVWEVLPNPKRKILLSSVYPYDRRYLVPRELRVVRKIINIFVFVRSLDIVEERLKERCGDDVASFDYKMSINRAYRTGNLPPHSPHFYFPPFYTLVHNDGPPEETEEKLTRIIPGLKERLQSRPV